MSIIKGPKTEKIIYYIYILMIGVFLLGFFCINLNPEQWYNFDIYADAMVAKYMSLDKTLFPEGWTFGNQLYTVATPVVAAIVCTILKDPIISLGVASCLMTLLTLGSFLWCLAPFTKKRGKCIGILCLIGGTLLGTTASSDPTGLQVFYTMASYYSCYMIGIFFTVGLWLRICSDRVPSPMTIIFVLLLNLLLSMQSLRELLVLNIPLLGISCLYSIGKRKEEHTFHPSKGCLFAIEAFVAGIIGIILIKIFEKQIPIHQLSVISEKKSKLWEGIIYNLETLGKYIGIQRPTDTYSWFKAIISLLCIFIVLFVSMYQLINRKQTPLAMLILYCWLSIGAIFCAGVLVVGTRPIYYFPWHILVAVCTVSMVEEICTTGFKKILALFTILVVGFSSLFFNSRLDIGRFRTREDDCIEITELLLDRGIRYVYYDGLRNFYAPQLAAYSDNQLITGAFFLHPQGHETGDLINRIGYLGYDDWFSSENRHSAYILLSEKSFRIMNSDYKDVLFSHLTPEFECTHLGEKFYFYSMDEYIAKDLNNEF